MGNYKIRRATPGDHQAILAVAKLSKYTRDFGNRIFSGPECYDAGRVRVCEGPGYKVAGFTCFRTRERDGVTVLYFIGAAKPGSGAGSVLLADLVLLSGGRVELKVMRDNAAAVRFYTTRGFREDGEAFDGKGVVLRLGERPPVNEKTPAPRRGR